MTVRLTEETAGLLSGNAQSFARHWGLVKRCHAASDGECSWKECPQKVKRESYCPLAKQDDKDREEFE